MCVATLQCLSLNLTLGFVLFLPMYQPIVSLLILEKFESVSHCFDGTVSLLGVYGKIKLIVDLETWQCVKYTFIVELEAILVVPKKARFPFSTSP